MQMLAIDVAKQSFHVHGVDAEGQMISRRFGRAGLVGLVERLGPAMVAMETCATAHRWARAFMAAVREARPIDPRFATPGIEGLRERR